MAEPVTIGGQTFIKTGDGWVDQKSKIRAPEGLLSLLNKLQIENSSEGKKKRVRIDTSRPVVKLGKTEYVWDLNGKVWIDKKTREASNPRFSLLIEATYQSTLGNDQLQDPGTPTPSTTAAKAAMKDALANNMFATNQKTKTSKTGSGTLPSMSNIKINSPIVQMIEKLATIDGYLKQRLNNNISSYNTRSVSTKEQSIEQGASQSDATPNLEQEKIDAEVEKANKESNGILLVAAVAAGALFISQLDPVKETFHAIVNFAKGVYDFASGIAGVINDGLRNIVGTPESRAAEKPSAETSSPATDVTQPADGMQQAGSKSSEQSEDSTPFVGPAGASGNKASGGSNGSTSAEEILTPFPGPKSSSKPETSGGATGSSGPTATPNATRVSSNSSTPAASAPVPVQAENSALAAYTGGAGKLSNDPAIRDKAFSAAPQTTDAAKQTSQVGSGRPSDILQFTARTGSESHFRGLPPNFQKALLDAGAEYKQTFGEKLLINSARRSPDEQRALKASGEYAVVDTPEHSPHVRGFGVDIGQRGKAANILGKYGIIWQKIPNDLVHYNYKGPGAATNSIWGSDTGGDKGGMFDKIMTAGADLTQGAMEAIGIIARAAFGKQKAHSGSQLLDFNDTMSGNIDKAAREKTGAMVDSKTPEAATAAIPTAISMSATSGGSTSRGSSSAKNVQAVSDEANIQWYLTRMGVGSPQSKYNALAGLRA
jgi:hypothetical protein